MNRTAKSLCLLSAVFLRGAAAAAPAETVLYSVTGGNDGSAPDSVTADAAGKLYGTAGGGAAGQGVIFQLSPPGTGQTAWSLEPLYPLAGGNDGSGPSSAIILGQSGNLFGTTWAGGGTGCYDHRGCGVVYQLSPPAGGQSAWSEAVLYAFAGHANGAQPKAPLLSPAGTLFGITPAVPGSYIGRLFKLTPPGTGQASWMKKTLHSFTGGAEGGWPDAGLIADSSGNLYGATWAGGSANEGTVYELAAPTKAVPAWTFSVLYNFSGAPAGNNYGPNVFALRDGVLYGTTTTGGNTGCSGEGCGTVFKLEPPSPGQTGWAETILHTFTGGTDGAEPTSLIVGADGIIYGTAGPGSSPNECCASVFRLTPPAKGKSAWTFRVEHRFTGRNGDGFAGYYPVALIAAGGELYGTTYGGGPNGKGTVFMITP
jgi:uncharacterized repeat protein (TIGR03803 family)